MRAAARRGRRALRLRGDLGRRALRRRHRRDRLHGLLAGFVSAGCAAAAIEASSHGLAQDRLAGVECDVAVFTNIGQDHLDYHVDWDDYLRAKSLLFSRPELQAAVVNADDAHAEQVAASASCETFACGESDGCDLAWRLAGRRAEFTHAGRSMGCELPMPGRHNASNLALAIGAALQAGAAWDEVEERLALLRPLPGRLEPIGAGAGRPAGYVDFAHTPEALAAALQALRAEHPEGRLLCVFGCGGDRDRSKRPLMGAAACAAADQVFVTTDNPRDEDPAAIAAEAMAGCDAKAVMILDRRAAIAAAAAAAGPADAVLVAGKGDEDEIIGPGGARTSFSDREVLRGLLAGGANG
ncbi:MAG: UDP-N-acetylmuramyl-tripeptide synthetase [Betaproteobacteria bacterium AqS2]|uniref:UDP-N-acetylmuramyl-tripeptide synthetase n=1 Tax=Candidatus Amphirhobacter heronislandensis TaxID=1732024 RepID=A0A930Y2U1_9GAMM|nr:UDP-N-acetylmuramyl-tripeptide synthetase [Betaproteobacteria bacterium AqS2]